MAQISKPPIPLKMYKHFAVATVSLTAGIAMFADSDNRQAVANHVEEREHRAQLQEVSAQNTTQTELVRRDRGNRGSFGDEAGISGAPTSVPQGGSSGGFAPAQPAGRISVSGYDQTFIEQMSEEEYRSFVAALPPEMREDRASRAEQRRAIEAASARRSGRRGSGSDAPT